MFRSSNLKLLISNEKLNNYFLAHKFSESINKNIILSVIRKIGYKE